MPVECPKCGSENCQSVQVVLDSGTQVVNLRTSSTSVGVGGGGLGVGGSSGTATGTVQSQLAKRLSAPPKPGGEFHAIAWVISIAIAGALKTLTRSDGLAIIVFFVLMTLYAVFIFKPLKAHWVQAHAHWKKLYDRGYHCNACGQVFLPEQ